MNKKYMILYVSLFLSILFLGFCKNSVLVSAAETHIYDDANLLDSKERSSLNEKMSSLEQKTSKYKIESDVDIYILTTNDLGGVTFTRYMEDFADEMEVTDAVILLISTDPANRVFEIHGYGTTEYYLNHTRINKIFDKMESDMRAGKYYEACVSYIDGIAKYMNKSPNTDGLFFEIWFQIIMSVCIGGLIVFMMKSQSGGKMTVSQSTYLDKANSRVLARRDTYINTTLKKTKRASDSDSSSSGGGSSSGGSSHSSGGGRSF